MVFIQGIEDKMNACEAPCTGDEEIGNGGEIRGAVALGTIIVGRFDFFGMTCPSHKSCFSKLAARASRD